MDLDRKPEQGAHSAEKSIRFEGTVEPGATVTAGRYETDVTPDGHWSIVLVLSPGGNLARFTAADASGKRADATVEGRPAERDYRVHYARNAGQS